MFLEITAPVGVLGIERTLPKGARIEFEQTASVLGIGEPSIVISGDDVDVVEEAIRANRSIEDVTRCSETEHRAIYRLTWNEPLPDLITHIDDTGGKILSAVAEDDLWTFELRFPKHEAGSRFYAQASDAEYQIGIQTMARDGGTRRSLDTGLTEKQRVVILRALEAGYFEVPRQATKIELAQEFDISDTAVSQRLRRGLTVILRDAILNAHDGVHAAIADDEHDSAASTRKGKV